MGSGLSAYSLRQKGRSHSGTGIEGENFETGIECQYAIVSEYPVFAARGICSHNG